MRNEIQVLRMLATAAKKALNRFPTTIEEDEKLLQIHTEPSYLRNCILMRHGEKQVYEFYQTLYDKAVPLLNTPWKDLRRRAARSYQRQENFDCYVVAVIVPLVKGSGGRRKRQSKAGGTQPVAP